jgi:hypothetical protein
MTTHQEETMQALPQVHREQPAAVTEMTPRGLLALAVQQNADLDKLERLMALQERWEANEARKAYVGAMAAFKANPPSLTKNKHVAFGNTKYDHATLDHVTDTIGAALHGHGLSHRWEVDQIEGKIKVACVLTHVLGHSERVTMEAPADTSGQKNSIQAIGSTVTYLQRYTLLAATGMAAKGMDDDGAGSGKRLPESVAADHLAALDSAADEQSLLKAYGAAHKAALESGDMGALRLFTQHKDARKKALGRKA